MKKYYGSSQTKNNPLSTILPSGMFHEVSRNSSSIDTLSLCIYWFIFYIFLFIHNWAVPTRRRERALWFVADDAPTLLAGYQVQLGKKKLEIQYNTIHIISYNTTQDPIGNNTTRPGTQHFSNTHNPAPQNSAVWNLQRAHELIERLLKGRSDAGKQLGVVCIYIYTIYLSCNILHITGWFYICIWVN